MGDEDGGAADPSDVSRAASFHARAVTANTTASAPWTTNTIRYAHRQLLPALTTTVTINGEVAAPIP